MTITVGHGEPVGFSAVDRTVDPAALVAALDDQATLPAIQRLRTAAIGLLDPRPGQRLLDAGCGTGDVSRALATRIGRRGSVVGVDPSETMLAEARRRTARGSEPAEFVAGDITALAASDGEFDGAYCERVLQHLTRPDRAVAELARVTTPGGRIVLVDTDWGMHAIHGADPALTARVVTSWQNAVPTGLAGRRLTALLADVGMRDTAAVAKTIIATDGRRATTEPVTTMAAFAVHAGALSTIEARTWLAQLVDAATAGRFFWAVTMFAVGGTRP